MCISVSSTEGVQDTPFDLRTSLVEREADGAVCVYGGLVNVGIASFVQTVILVTGYTVIRGVRLLWLREAEEGTRVITTEGSTRVWGL